jgi:integrase
MGSFKTKKDKDGKLHYYAQVRIKGFPPQNAAFTRKTDMDRWIQQTESAIREGRHFKTVEAKKHTVGEMIDRYIRDVLPTKKKSEKKQTAQLTWWKEQIGCYLLSDITPAMIAEKRDLLLKGVTVRGKLRSTSTTVRYMAALSHAFTVAMKEFGWIDDSPIRKVSKPREPRGRVRFLSDDERASLLQACKESGNQYLYTIVVIALSCGLRQMEILTLNWNAVDLDRGRIILHETKNGEIRQVPLTGHALELLRKYDKVRRLDTQLLFPGRFPNKPIDIRSAWDNAVKQSGITNFKFHDLRHSAASALAMAGATLTELSEILGHKTLAMVKRYSHLSDSHTVGIVTRMNEKLFG